MSLKVIFLIASALFYLLSVGQVLGQEQITVLRGATLIDVASSRQIENSIVVMERGRIRAVGKETQVSFPADARIIEVNGKFLIPGFIDPHVHYRDWSGEIFLANGTTSVLDQGNPTEWMLALKEAQQKGKIRSPRLFVTGQPLDGTYRDSYFAEFGYLDSWVNGHVLDLVPSAGGTGAGEIKYEDSGRFYKTYLNRGEDARLEVRRLIQRGVDAIKVYHKLTPVVLKAITEETHRANLPVVGHRLDARELVELGMDFVEHTSPVAIATIMDKQKLQELKEGKLLDPHPYMDPNAFPDLARTLVKKKIFFNPTLSGTWRHVTPRRKQYREEFKTFFGQPALSYIPRAYLKHQLDEYNLFDRITSSEADLLQKGYRNVERFLKTFSNAGGKVLFGSDQTGFPGLAIHQEMELLVDAGISRGEALKAATVYAAELLRKEKDLGTVEVGKLADLVVLGADPLVDIRNTRKIEMVFLGGERVDTSFHPDYKIPIPRPVVDAIESGMSPILSANGILYNVIPNIAVEGEQDLTIELVGHFFPSSKVTFNRVPIQSTFESPARLKAVIPATLLKDVGTYPLQVEESFQDHTIRSNPVFFMVKYR